MDHLPLEPPGGAVDVKQELRRGEQGGKRSDAQNKDTEKPTYMCSSN